MDARHVGSGEWAVRRRAAHYEGGAGDGEASGSGGFPRPAGSGGEGQAEQRTAADLSLFAGSTHEAVRCLRRSPIGEQREQRAVGGLVNGEATNRSVDGCEERGPPRPAHALSDHQPSRGRKPRSSASCDAAQIRSSVAASSALLSEAME